MPTIATPRRQDRTCAQDQTPTHPAEDVDAMLTLYRRVMFPLGVCWNRQLLTDRHRARGGEGIRRWCGVEAYGVRRTEASRRCGRWSGGLDIQSRCEYRRDLTMKRTEDDWTCALFPVGITHHARVRPSMRVEWGVQLYIMYGYPRAGVSMPP